LMHTLCKNGKQSMEKSSKIYVAGHKGLVGSAIMRLLQKEGFTNLVFRTSAELDLRNADEVATFFEKEKPAYVFLAAAKVGGIVANNTYGADFIYDNLMLQNNIIFQSHKNGVKKLLFLGSSCIYPKLSAQPIKEDYLLTGALEPTNSPYAVAKIAGIEMCKAYFKQYGCNFVSIMPTNLYGPGDNYNLQNSHVLPALLRKFHEANINGSPSVEVWGSGEPRREFLYVDDMAAACLHVMLHYNNPNQILNVGCGCDYSIKEMAETIKEIVGYKGEIVFDTTKPDGAMQKLLDVHLINQQGWQATTTLQEGLHKTYQDFCDNYNYYTTK
jgi:GDP-L-fucose synthase